MLQAFSWRPGSMQSKPCWKWWTQPTFAGGASSVITGNLSPPVGRDSPPRWPRIGEQCRTKLGNLVSASCSSTLLVYKCNKRSPTRKETTRGALFCTMLGEGLHIWAAGQLLKSPDNPPQPLLLPSHPWKGDWSRKGRARGMIFERVTSSWPVTEVVTYCTSTWPPFCHDKEPNENKDNTFNNTVSRSTVWAIEVHFFHMKEYSHSWHSHNTEVTTMYIICKNMQGVVNTLVLHHARRLMVRPAHVATNIRPYTTSGIKKWQTCVIPSVKTLLVADTKVKMQNERK